MKMSNGTVTVFPTELAKRRAERAAVLESGVIDTSLLFTQKKLMDTCERAARRTGLLTGRIPGEAELRLLLEQTAGSVPFAPHQPLARLSAAARADLLKELIAQLAFLADDIAAVTEWLLAHEPAHKLHGLGQLLGAWIAACEKANLAARFTVNRALLRLIEREELPPELNDEIHFRAVRWFNPFEERFVAALKTRLGPERVQIFSVLPGEHAQAAGDRLCAAVRNELGSEEEWKQWTEDFADAYEADDSNILEADSSGRVLFFVSAHPYGEIEDAARRIAGEIERGTKPEEIALILRDLSPYTDIIPDVFQRFGIPYYFRRGTPAAAYPPVKALIALLAFPQTRSRDRLCDLLLSPAIDWPGVDDREALIHEIRKTQPPRLHRLPKELKAFFQYPKDASFSDRANDLIEKHGLNLPGEALGLIVEMDQITEGLFDSERMVSLFEELLENITLKDELSTERGVWVINPMDAAGLRFQTVFIAGMDDRNFPQVPKANPLLNSRERNALRAFLSERNIHCPRLALSETSEALIQEEILFLTALSCATEKLWLSYTRSDADGKERAPGEFFERMRGLAKIEKPAHGESFHTILPPESVHAEDEARQTEAWIAATMASRSKSEIRSSKSETNLENSKFEIRASDLSNQAACTGCADLIQKWLEQNPEFSATALESLARNRYVFFLEKVLGIKPDRTHEDNTDPLDRGTLVHDILELVYTTIAGQSGRYAKKVSNVWKLSQKGGIPLAVFSADRLDEYLALARKIAEEEIKKAERRPSRHLGHPSVWETEKRKLHQVVENVVRMDCETAQAENRYPALFEMKFDETHGLPVALQNPCCRAGTVGDLPAAAGRSETIPALQVQEICLKGKIDRIDLIFDDDGELQQLLVVDYKGKSKTDTAETIAKKTALNLDCQLALYTFAAQQFFFGEHNTPELNEKTQAVYQLQERDLQKMTKHFGNDKKRLTMTPELTEQFLETLFSNVWKLSNGDLATEPLIAGYDDYSHICRTTAIEPEELLDG